MYTLCYVLVDSPELSFYNEMMISINSFRYYGNEGPILVIVDQETYKFISVKQDELQKYKVGLKAIDVPAEYDQKAKSRFLKTNLRSYLEGDFLFVDTDTVFADKLPAVIVDQDIAMVTDHHCKVLAPNTRTYNYALPLARKSGKALPVGEAYFNSGVSWVRDTEITRKLYRMWHRCWVDSHNRGVLQDQHLLNYINQKLGKVISRLDDRYNVQVSDGENIPFHLLKKAAIIHYFHPREDQQTYLLSIPTIRQNHYESDIIQEIIQSPKTAFIDGKMVASDIYFEVKNMTETLQYHVLKRLYSHKSIFMFNERCLRKIMRIRNFIRELSEKNK